MAPLVNSIKHLRMKYQFYAKLGNAGESKLPPNSYHEAYKQIFLINVDAKNS